MEESRDVQIDTGSSIDAENMTADTVSDVQPTETADGLAEPTSTEVGSSLSATAGNVARSLKPVAEAAESLAGHAISLSAKGINWLDATLVERKKQREENGAISETPAPPVELPGGGDSAT